MDRVLIRDLFTIHDLQIANRELFNKQKSCSKFSFGTAFYCYLVL